MSGVLKQYVSEMNLEAFVMGCQKSTGLSLDDLQDAIFGVLSSLLHREAEFVSKFLNAQKFYAYVRTASIREAIRMHRKQSQSQELDEHISNKEDTPEANVLQQEQQYLTHQALLGVNEWVRSELIKMGKSKATIEHCEILLNELKLQPRHYVSERRSGKSKGDYVFDQAKLVEALGWDKRRVSERLNIIQQAIANHMAG